MKSLWLKRDEKLKDNDSGKKKCLDYIFKCIVPSWHRHYSAMNIGNHISSKFISDEVFMI